jgi:hypothetical protein
VGSGFEPQAPHLRKRHLLILLREKTVSSHEHRLPCLCERGIRSRKVTASPSHRNQLPTRCGGGPGRRRVRPRADHSHMRPRAREHCDGCSPRGSGGSASGTNSSAGSHRTGLPLVSTRGKGHRGASSGRCGRRATWWPEQTPPKSRRTRCTATVGAGGLPHQLTMRSLLNRGVRFKCTLQTGDGETAVQLRSASLLLLTSALIVGVAGLPATAAATGPHYAAGAAGVGDPYYPSTETAGTTSSTTA